MGYDPRTGDGPGPDFTQAGDRVVSLDLKSIFDFLKRVFRRSK